MSRNAPDPRLEALLRDLPAPPPVPAGLAARVLAAAAETPQEARPMRARRAAARRDRRGRWLRRPLLASTVALGLVVSSAVAATLAGVPIPQKIAAVLFPEEKAPEPKQVAAPRRAPRPPVATPAPAPVQLAEAPPEPEVPAWQMGPNPWRRLMLAQRMIAARRAMGLPTPGADRLEGQLRRRAELWQAATPEQRAAWAARQQLRQDLHRAMLSTPEGREELARQEQRQRWQARRGMGMPMTPEQQAERRAMMQDWRARRQAGLPPTPEEQAARQAWRLQRQAGRPPLTEEQRAFRQEQFRRWREARRARWQEMNGQSAANGPAGTEGPATPAR